jgi:hypothetical protein
MSPALTATQIAAAQKNGEVFNNTESNNRNNSSSDRVSYPAGAGDIAHVQPPSNSMRQHQMSSAVRISVPSNWEAAVNSNTSVTYAPTGAVFQGDNGHIAFTHGVEVGTSQGTGNLQRDTDALLRSFSQGNPDLRQSGNDRGDRIGGRTGITITLDNVSDVTGDSEYIALSTTQLRDGSLLYMIGVAPKTQQSAYDSAFKKIRQSIQISDR